jgi:membrane-bound ClpP family serine protease
VRSEQWTATSSTALQTGDDILVVEHEGLQLYVEAVKHKHAPHEKEEIS